MRPIRLSLKDFTNHAESDIDFSILSPATLIVGIENGSEKASNAVGKTNIFNAIKYVLFNSRISNEKNKVIRDGTKKCTVEFTFEIKNETYKIERFRTRSSQGVQLFKFIEDKFVDVSGKTSSTTDQMIQDILGINEQTFENSSYLRQNDYSRKKIDTLAAATPEDRKSIIIDLLQLNMWNKFEKKAKDIRDEANIEFSKSNSLIQSLGDPETEIAINQQKIEEISSIMPVIENNILKLSSYINDKKEIKSKLSNSISNEYPLLQTKLKNELSSKNNIIKDIANLNSQKIRLESECLSLNNKLNDNNQKLSLYEKQNQSTEKTDEPTDNLQGILDIISKLKANIRDNRSQLMIVNKPIPDGEFCQECGTELSNDFKHNSQDKKDQKAKELIELIQKDESELKIYSNNKSIIENKQLKYNQYIEIINRLSSLISLIKNQNEEHQKSLESKNSLISSCISDISIKNSSLEECNKNILNINEKMEKINNNKIEEEIKIIDQNIKEKQKELSQQQSNLSSNVYQLGQLKATLQRWQEDLDKIDKYKSERKTHQNKFNLYKAVVSCFNSSGIPAMIIHNVLGTLQTETNKILDQLKPGIQLKFIVNKEKDDGTNTDTLNIVYYINGVEKDFSDLSGGQQASVVLSMKFATAEIVRNRCGADIQILLLDEVDQALDEQSVESFYEILHRLSKDITILVITHDKELKNRFKSFIVVNKNGEASYAEAVNE